MGIEYPVAIDNDYAVWDAFANRAWPALYIADADGRIRHHHLGEGGEEQSEHVIRSLLADAGAESLPDAPAPVEARRGIEVPADWHNVRSPETYVGLAHAPRVRVYRRPRPLPSHVCTRCRRACT